MARKPKPKAKIVLDYQDKPVIPWDFPTTVESFNSALLEHKLPGQIRPLVSVLQKFGVEISRHYVDLILHLRALKKFFDEVFIYKSFFPQRFLKFSSDFFRKYLQNAGVFYS